MIIGTNVGVPRGGPERIRTSDTRFRKPLLYPLSYGAGICAECRRARKSRRRFPAA